MLSLPKQSIIAWSLLLCFAGATPSNAGLLPERVEKAAQDRIATETNQTLVFAVEDGDKSEITVFGKLDDGKRPDGNTVYEIGSITKTFTATMLAQAVLLGHVTLETPVGQLLPGFAVPSRNDRLITLADLATQHSGLPRLPINMEPMDLDNPYADYSPETLKAFLLDYRLPRDPGASYEYSNLGFGLLGYALGQMEHKSYPALVDEKILKPLNMKITATAFPPTARIRRAQGHDEVGKTVENWDFDALAGAGALRSTARDMLRYLRANMGIDPSPLSAAMKFAQDPRSDMNRLTRIGLAWMTTNKGIVWHNGATGGYRSFIGFTADRRRGVVVLTNTAIAADDLGFATLDPTTSLAPAYQAVALSAAALDEYVGTYMLGEKARLKVSRMGDALVAQATGQLPVPIFSSAADQFFARVARLELSFTRDAENAVNGLILHQYGDHMGRKLDTSELPPEPQEIDLDAKVLAGYSGKYRFETGAILDVVSKNDHLEARLGLQPAFPIFASARDRFFYRIVNAQLDFERAADGSIVGVTLHQNGRDDLHGSRIAIPAQRHL